MPLNNDEQRLYFDFKLIVENFLNYPGEVDEAIISENFGGKTDLIGVKWNIHALTYPKKLRVKNGWKYPMSVFVKIDVDPANVCLAISAKYQILQLQGKAEWATSKRNTRGRDGKGFDQLVNFKVFPFFANDNLSLRFKGKAYIQFKPSELRRNEPNLIMADTMKKLFHEGTGYDVVIKTGSYEFKGHKCVLSARSDYFRAMFESGMKEDKENSVDFGEQMKEDELKDLLEFLYLGSASNLSNTCRGILNLADMFGLPQLKLLGEEMLADNITEDNAWEMAQFARERGAINLQKKAHLILAKPL